MSMEILSNPVEYFLFSKIIQCIFRSVLVSVGQPAQTELGDMIGFKSTLKSFVGVLFSW